MKRRMKPLVYSTISAMALSMCLNVSVFASEYNYASTTMAIADVIGSLNIREQASEDSAIIGSLYAGSGAEILANYGEWCLICSGEVTGYVKTEFLAVGESADYLASVYGVPGDVMAANYTGAPVYSAADYTAPVLGTACEGQQLEVVSNDGVFAEVSLYDGSTGYMALSDLSYVPVLDTAVPTETYTVQESTDSTSYDTGYSNTTDTYSDTSYEDGYVPETYVEESYETEAPVYEEPVYETEAPVYEEPVYETEAPVYEEPVYETEAPVYEEPVYETEAPVYEEPVYETEPATNVSADDLTLLAAIIYCEAGNQPWDGKVAVGAVVLNRVASSSFPDTIYDVIYQSGQFTPASNGSLASALANGVPDECVQAAQAALNGENPVGGALYFNTGSGQGMVIGDHQFY